MRISDWSSDVCSSDLLGNGIYYGDSATTSAQYTSESTSSLTISVSDSFLLKPNSLPSVHAPSYLRVGAEGSRFMLVSQVALGLIDRKSVVWERVCQYV